MLLPLAALSQTANFTIVWVNVGEVASAPTQEQPPRVGKQLFMAPDLVQLSLRNITVARVDAEPSVIPMVPGEQLCLTSLHITAVGHDRAIIADAPLTVAVRQDQRERLNMARAKNDICFAPTTPGEYPVRITSLLPARDGTTRGAQVFLRVQGEDLEKPESSMSTATKTRELRTANRY